MKPKSTPMNTVSDKKLYLGGYRNKRTGLEYHNATTQTERFPFREKKDMAQFCSKYAQTSDMSSKGTQMSCESDTQMNRKCFYVEDVAGRTYIPKPYFSADQLLGKKYLKSIMIQKCWRGYIGRKYVEEIMVQQKNEEVNMTKSKLIFENAMTEKHLKDMERRLHPQNKKDFEILYSELQSWKREEINKIEILPTESEAEKKAMEYLLLEKETKLLQRIDAMKVEAMECRKMKRIEKMLNSMTQPKLWKMSDGDVTEVHTPFTTRAIELKQMYRNLVNTNISVDDRLEVLLKIKQTVSCSDCILTRDISELIDREADLLNRGRKDHTLAGLRRRLSNLFMQYIEIPDFNPERKRFLKMQREMQ